MDLRQADAGRQPHKEGSRLQDVDGHLDVGQDPLLRCLGPHDAHSTHLGIFLATELDETKEERKYMNVMLIYIYMYLYDCNSRWSVWGLDIYLNEYYRLTNGIRA